MGVKVEGQLAEVGGRFGLQMWLLFEQWADSSRAEVARQMGQLQFGARFAQHVRRGAIVVGEVVVLQIL